MKVKNYICACCYGLFGSLVLICLITIDMFTKWHEPPEYASDISVVIMIISLITVASAFIVNCINIKRTTEKGHTILTESIIFINTFIIFLLIWAELSDIIILKL